MDAVLISGSPSPVSKSRMLLEHARSRLETASVATTLLDLSALPAEPLLGRRGDDNVRGAIEAVTAAQIVVASSPTYRASYSGLLKAFFDLLPQDCLLGRVGVPILTGGGPGHQLALDHGFRPLLASLGATVVAGVYGWDAQFRNGPDASLLAKVDAAIDESVSLAGILSPRV